jgi:hypothetical protein
MRINASVSLGTKLLALAGLVVATGFSSRVSAQSPELQQQVAEIKEAAAKNKQALAQYTWNELVIVSLKGEQKKQEHFQVRLGPDGKPQRLRWIRLKRHPKRVDG